MDLFEVAAIGIQSNVQQLNMISHNLANVSTSGFKKLMAVNNPIDMSHAMTMQRQELADFSSPTKMVDWTPGSLTRTGNPLDVAIKGEGLFTFSGENGLLYGRNGSFSLDESGYLVTPQGHYVQGTSGNIRLTTEQVSINKQGQIYQQDQLLGQLTLATFNQKTSLIPQGDGMFKASAPAQDLPHDNLAQGYVETSNVTKMDEMVDLIALVRRVELGQKLVRSYDEILDSSIQTLGEI